MVLFSFWVTFIHNVCLFVSFPFVIWCLLCQYFFPPSGIQSVRVLSKTDGHLLLVHVATQMVPPASHTEPPAKVYIYWKRCLLFTELIQSARRGLGISVSNSSADGSFGGQVCSSVHKRCLTLALSPGSSLACCLPSSGPAACVQNSGGILDTFPLWLPCRLLKSVCATVVDLTVRPRPFHGAAKAFLF